MIFCFFLWLGTVARLWGPRHQRSLEWDVWKPASNPDRLLRVWYDLRRWKILKNDIPRPFQTLGVDIKDLLAGLKDLKDGDEVPEDPPEPEPAPEVGHNGTCHQCKLSNEFDALTNFEWWKQFFQFPPFKLRRVHMQVHLLSSGPVGVSCAQSHSLRVSMLCPYSSYSSAWTHLRKPLSFDSGCATSSTGWLPWSRNATWTVKESTSVDQTGNPVATAWVCYALWYSSAKVGKGSQATRFQGQFNQMSANASLVK